MMNRMVKKDFAQEIAAVIRTAKNGDRLPELLKHYHWRDVAKAITLLADAERERLFRQMDAQTLAEIFPYLDDASRYLAELPAALAAEMIADMDTADALDMLRELPEEKKQTLAAHLDDDTRKDVRRLLAFHQEEIGSRMSGNFVCIPDTLTVCGAMNELVLLHRCTDTSQEVGRFGHRLTSYGNHTLKQRFIFLNSFINSKCRTHILHNCPSRDRQRTTCHLAFGNRINQLFLTTLRIFHFQRNNFDACITGSNFRHQFNSIRLVILNSDKCLIYLHGFHQNGDTYHDFFRVFQHQLMVGSQIRFTFYGIDNHTFSFKRRRRTKFHLCRETSTTQTYDTGIGNLLHNFFRRKIAFFHQCLAAVDCFFPFVAFHIDKDSRFRITAGIDYRINLRHFTTDRRMNCCRNKAGRFGNLRAYLHHITLCHYRFGRCANVLGQRINHDLAL